MFSSSTFVSVGVVSGFKFKIRALSTAGAWRVQSWSATDKYSHAGRLGVEELLRIRDAPPQFRYKRIPTQREKSNKQLNTKLKRKLHNLLYYETPAVIL